MWSLWEVEQFVYQSWRSVVYSLALPSCRAIYSLRSIGQRMFKMGLTDSKYAYAVTYCTGKSYKNYMYDMGSCIPVQRICEDWSTWFSCCIPTSAKLCILGDIQSSLPYALLRKSVCAQYRNVFLDHNSLEKCLPPLKKTIGWWASVDAWLLSSDFRFSWVRWRSGASWAFPCLPLALMGWDYCSLTFTFQVRYMTNTGVHVLSLWHTRRWFFWLCFVLNCYWRKSEDRNTPKEAGPAPKQACNW